MSDLKCMVYVSTAAGAMSQGELERLLTDARRLNLEAGITGVLLYSGGNFMQYFEGREGAVAITYDRIRASRLHRDIIELLDEPIDVREFPDWQMGFGRPPSSQLLAISNATWLRRAEREDTGRAGSHGMALLRQFLVNNP